MDDDDGKPSTLIGGGHGATRWRWYPHKTLETITHGVVHPLVFDLPWHLLDPADAAEHLPALRDSLGDLGRFVAMIEDVAEGREVGRLCPVCASRFYPSRADAVYCSGRCRTRAYRGTPST